jgi:hypothetical protein
MLLLVTTDLSMGEDGFLLAKLCKQHVEMKCTLFARPDIEQNKYKRIVSHGGVGYLRSFNAITIKHAECWVGLQILDSFLC